LQLHTQLLNLQEDLVYPHNGARERRRSAVQGRERDHRKGTPPPKRNATATALLETKPPYLNGGLGE
jgi:hypothetical protein